MVAPFGFGVGDIPAVSKLIVQITGELRKNGQATPEYQRLIVELDALDRGLRQLFALRSAPSDGLRLDSIRALATTCQAHLEAFFLKIAKFEQALGPGHGASPSAQITRRLQWTLHHSKDINALRTKLSSHVATINLLLLTQTVESLTVAQKDREENHQETEDHLVSQDKLLEIQTQQLSDIQSDIELVGEAISSTQAIVVMTDTKVDGIFGTTVEILQMVTAGANSLQQIAGRLSRLLHLIANFTEEMRQVVGGLVDMFVQLQRTISRLENFIPLQLYIPMIKFRDAFGVPIALPYELSKEWQTFQGLIGLCFMNKQGKWRVERGLYTITNKRIGTAISPAFWSNAVQPGDELSMAMILNEYSAAAKECPWPSCGASLEAAEPSDGGTFCPRCFRWVAQPFHRRRLAITDSSKPFEQEHPTIKQLKRAGTILEEVRTETEKSHFPDPNQISDKTPEDVELYKLIQVPIQGETSFKNFHAGSKFSGHQLGDPDQEARMLLEVSIANISVPESTLIGYMKYTNDIQPEFAVITYFEAEILGPKHDFRTEHKWGSTPELDEAVWSRCQAWCQLPAKIRSNVDRIDRWWEQRFVFMRWKEVRAFKGTVYKHSESNIPSIAGFYYICCDQERGHISGVWHNSDTQITERLELDHVSKIDENGTIGHSCWDMTYEEHREMAHLGWSRYPDPGPEHVYDHEEELIFDD